MAFHPLPHPREERPCWELEGCCSGSLASLNSEIGFPTFHHWNHKRLPLTPTGKWVAPPEAEYIIKMKGLEQEEHWVMLAFLTASTLVQPCQEGAEGMWMLRPQQGPPGSGQKGHRSGRAIMVLTITVSVFVQRWLGGVKGTTLNPRGLR